MPSCRAGKIDGDVMETQTESLRSPQARLRSGLSGLFCAGFSICMTL